MFYSISKYRKISLIIFHLFIIAFAWGQGKITGTVKDRSDGNLIPLVTVSVSPSGKTTITDEYGLFSIKVEDEEPLELSFSHISYKPFTQKINPGELHSRQVTVQLEPDSVVLSDMVITANRIETDISEIPTRVGVIDMTRIYASPSNSSDDLLRNESNIFINRTQGIFSKSAGIMMRGLSGTARTLVLVDGVPLNKTAGGSVPWNILLPDEMVSIEVVKGPVSSIYGGNAMAGVINMRSYKPVERFSLKGGLFYGSYNTFGGKFRFQGNEELEKGNFYYKAGAFYRKGDGYYLLSEDEGDTLRDKAYLEEYQLNLKTGYHSGSNTIEFNYQQYYSVHGTGVKVYEPGGSHDDAWHHLLSATYRYASGPWDLSVMLFSQFSDEHKVKERVNKSGVYKLTDDYGNTFDGGSWISARRKAGIHTITAGLDFKLGIQDEESIYRTSTDHLMYEGKLIFGGLFIQDEIAFRDFPLRISAGLRADWARFYDGSLAIEEPTSNTGFIQSENFSYTDNSWSRLSPKISFLYDFSDQYNVYLSFGSGFNPPKLDDLVRSGKISKGFKLANPQLKPEWVNTFEAGANLQPAKGLTIAVAAYYTTGDDFQYFVATGDSLEDAGSQRPILQRENISKVDIIGAELDAKYRLLGKHEIFLNGAYNDSRIKEFKGDPEINKDLTGKYLIEVPAFLLNSGFNFYHRWFNATVIYSYFGEQWYDDENTQRVQDYATVGVKISKTIGKQWKVMLTIDNLFNTEYRDRKGYLGPGRFIIAEINYRFIKPN
jgi:iron complex outermembrane receptor protein